MLKQNPDRRLSSLQKPLARQAPGLQIPQPQSLHYSYDRDLGLTGLLAALLGGGRRVILLADAFAKSVPNCSLPHAGIPECRARQAEIRLVAEEDGFVIIRARHALLTRAVRT